MMKATLSLFLLICGVTAICEQVPRAGSQKAVPPQGMCEAAQSKLHTDKVVLTMVVDASGRVQSFTTDSPKGLRLEKMKEPAAAIKVMHFEPAKKDGRPVTVMVRTEFDCSVSSTHTGPPSQ